MPEHKSRPRYNPIYKPPRQPVSATPPPERRDAAENRAQILQAARQLFAKQGVEATSMAEIARRAGVGQGTLYRRYADKGELCQDLLKENADEFRTQLDSYVAWADGLALPALSQLQELLRRLLAFSEQNASLLNAIWLPSYKRKSYDNSFYLYLRNLVRTRLDAAVERGECPPMNTELVAELVLAPTTIWFYNHLRRLGYTQSEILRTQWALLCQGLTGPSPKEPAA